MDITLSNLHKIKIMHKEHCLFAKQNCVYLVMCYRLTDSLPGQFCALAILHSFARVSIGLYPNETPSYSAS